MESPIRRVPMRPHAVDVWKWLPRLSDEAVDAVILYIAMGFFMLGGICLFLDITPQDIIAAILKGL